MKKFDAPAVRRISTAFCTSMPALVAMARPSRLTHVVVKAIRLLSSFMVLPSPNAPTWKVARPSGSSTGRTRATGSSSPPTMNTSIRFSAPMAPPVRGASTRWCPEAARRAPKSRTTAGLLVDRSTRMAPGAAAPAHAVATSATTSGVGNDSSVTSAWRATDATSGAAVAPVIAAIAAASTSWTTTSLPSATRLAAMAPPILPSPITPVAIDPPELRNALVAPPEYVRNESV